MKGTLEDVANLPPNLRHRAKKDAQRSHTSTTPAHVSVDAKSTAELNRADSPAGSDRGGVQDDTVLEAVAQRLVVCPQGCVWTAGPRAGINQGCIGMSIRMTARILQHHARELSYVGLEPAWSCDVAHMYPQAWEANDRARV